MEHDMEEYCNYISVVCPYCGEQPEELDIGSINKPQIHKCNYCGGNISIKICVSKEPIVEKKS